MKAENLEIENGSYRTGVSHDEDWPYKDCSRPSLVFPSSSRKLRMKRLCGLARTMRPGKSAVELFTTLGEEEKRGLEALFPALAALEQRLEQEVEMGTPADALKRTSINLKSPILCSALLMKRRVKTAAV